ncbi:MAG TPA: hypothetical protein VE604_00330 [Candidatus Polarisedimenticolia bacterium]|nr:hypothetical protein [Candidatus Polarisedimenticolia bacterium]
MKTVVLTPPDHIKYLAVGIPELAKPLAAALAVQGPLRARRQIAS